MQGATLDRELWLRADPASASVARTFVGSLADELHYEPSVREALRLAVTEAVANAIEHGAPCGGLISVAAYVETDCLTTEVSDCGDFQTAPQRPGDLHDRGRGLQLMFAAVDHVEIDAAPGRTVVRLAKRLPS